LKVRRALHSLPMIPTCRPALGFIGYSTIFRRTLESFQKAVPVRSISKMVPSRVRMISEKLAMEVRVRPLDRLIDTFSNSTHWIRRRDYRLKRTSSKYWMRLKDIHAARHN